jgi:NIMA (never in mitosis gene a)-related kinase
MCTFRPPFTANDLNGLKKRIIAGHYDRIPEHYSEDLENFIRLCLTTNSKERPSAEALLQSTHIRKRIYLYPNERFNEATF